jgi:signal peptidase I
MERTPSGPPAPGRARFFRRVKDAAEILGVTVLLALVLKTFVIDAVHVPSASMENTLLVGDFLLVNKFVYGPCTPRFLPFRGSRLPVFRLPGPGVPRRGDVIVFYAPEEETHHRLYVKRVVAVPGDTVMIRRGLLTVNGAAVDLPARARVSGKPAPDFGPAVVPKKGEMIPLGEAEASRWEPLVERDGHTCARGPGGEVIIDGTPQREYRVGQEYFFVLGDNRDESLDSRSWGFVPFESIVGRAMVVYWSVDPDSGVRWSRTGTVVR